MLEVDVSGPIARLTLNRPEKRNALSPGVLRALMAACEQIAASETVRVVVLDAAGGAFSAGADLMEFLPELHSEEGQAAADLGRLAAEALAGLPQPTVAAVQGSCVGGGVVLVSCCDLVVASAAARFRVPELEMGIPFAWGGTTRLVQRVGAAVAADLVMTCRWFEALEAQRVGLVSRVVPEPGFAEAVEEVCAALAGRPRGALRYTKAQVSRAREGRPDDPRDADALLEALGDPEAQEAAQRYLMALVGANTTG